MAPDGPTVVFTPAHPVAGGETPSFALEPRRMADGISAVIAFSSVEALVAQLGRYQPWMGFSPEDLRRIAYANGIKRVYLDPKVYPFEPRWAPVHLEQIWSD